MGALTAAALDAHAFKPIIYVLFAYTLLFYLFLYGQSFWVYWLWFKARRTDPKTPLAKVKYGEAMARDRLVFDRSVGNLMEQSVPFLLSFLLSAAFGGDVGWTALLGWSYVSLRVLYPLAFKFGVVPLVTVPNYLSVGLLLYSVYVKL